MTTQRHNESHFVVGTRGSALARWQTEHVSARVAAARARAGVAPVVVDTRVITTQGDTSLAERLVGQIEKGFFTAELEAELRSGAIDWAVHSLKDLPTRLPADLQVAAVLERASPADLLVVAKHAFVDRGPHAFPVKDGARIGTSSLRRDAMLRAHAPRCASQPLRGNVPTRIEKLRSGAYDAIVLARAGVERLALPLDDFSVVVLEPRRWQPAPGQGAVAVEARAGDAAVLDVVGAIDHAPTRSATELERSFLRVLEGGCSTPFGCYVTDARAYLGREVDGTWRSHVVALPEDAAVLDERFIHRALDTLKGAPPARPQEHSDEHSLWSPI